ncbi:MAG TPA: HEPN domain-containing protein [Chloroflexota bacterium]|jgi:HEPN domain-containing protein|nr:HEPN domain-containing protein [Chloroflexota bacterium]
MPDERAHVADTRAWLLKAADDLRAAETDLLVRPPLTSDTTFHAQQLAEKAMKAFLTWHDRPFRKTHNRVEVGQACVEIDASLQTLLGQAAALTEYAWAFRYPGDPEEPTLQEAEDALAIGREVYKAILARLPAEVHP